MKFTFSLKNYKDIVMQGKLLPTTLSYGHVDEAKFDKFLKKHSNNSVGESFKELRHRMSDEYFRNVLLAQSYSLDYASLHFPAYSMLISEDLNEDWLAIVDFHKKHSRDHSLHQPLTAYIAAALLGYGDSDESLGIPSSPGNLLDFCVDVIFTSKDASYIRENAVNYGLPPNMFEDNPASREFWKELFYNTVILSAYFHDIGYPWQYVDRIESNLGRAVDVLNPIDDLITRILNGFDGRMIILPLNHYMSGKTQECLEERKELRCLVNEAMKTHGFPGAIAFLSLNDSIKKFATSDVKAKLKEFSIEWAAMGIFMHDMADVHKKLYPKLKLNILQDPLSTIVALSDYLEEFNRPKVSFCNKIDRSIISYCSDCSQVELESNVNCGTLSVKMTYEKDASKAVVACFKKDETEDYFNQGSGYLDLSPIGIRKVIYE